MCIKKLLCDYLGSIGKDEMLRSFNSFYDICNDEEYDSALTKNVLGNVGFKHGFAKYIVKRVADGEWLTLSSSENLDARLTSFIMYYAVVSLLNHDLDSEIVNRLKALIWCDVHSGCYLPGLAMNMSGNQYAPVRMSPGGGIHPGYRVFTINLLCFGASRFLIGIRGDSGPVMSMKYHKGCFPVGVRSDAKGRIWTLFKVDSEMTDDNTAIFSNFLDGDGTVEVCDWINEFDVRIVFRCNL